jgi:hypothetical protein
MSAPTFSSHEEAHAHGGTVQEWRERGLEILGEFWPASCRKAVKMQRNSL